MTTTFEHILVPTDFGEPANRAIDMAAAMALKFGSRLTVLHCSWLAPMAYAAYAEGLVFPTEDLTKAADAWLAKSVARAKEVCPIVESVVIAGEPAETILSVAQERQVDLIVMGTQGRRGLSHVLLGSVAEKIVRLSPVPVLTVSAKGSEPAKS